MSLIEPFLLVKRVFVFTLNNAIDNHSRVAYAETHDGERGETCAGFVERTIAFYAALGVKVERVITHNAFAYRHSTRQLE